MGWDLQPGGSHSIGVKLPPPPGQRSSSKKNRGGIPPREAAGHSLFWSLSCLSQHFLSSSYRASSLTVNQLVLWPALFSTLFPSRDTELAFSVHPGLMPHTGMGAACAGGSIRLVWDLNPSAWCSGCEQMGLGGSALRLEPAPALCPRWVPWFGLGRHATQVQLSLEHLDFSHSDFIVAFHFSFIFFFPPFCLACWEM